jgi:hypothetical protein
MTGSRCEKEMGISTWASSSEALRMQAVLRLVNWVLGPFDQERT